MRPVTGLAAAAATTLIASVAHAAGGGGAPPPDVALLALLVLTLTFTKLPMRWLPLVGAAVGSQIGLHVVFGLGLGSAPVMIVSEPAHAGHSALTMLFSHAVAALVCTGFVGRGLEVLARTARTIGRLLARVLLPPGPLSTAPGAGFARVESAVVAIGRVRRPWSRCLPSRGPPPVPAST